MAELNIQKTSTSALSTEMQTYYDRKLLKNMKPNLVHYEFGQKRQYKRQNGKTINFRKFTPFSAITTALTEGTPPDGQNLAMTDTSATVAQYGGYVAVSDLLDLTAIDPILEETNELLADQAALSVDTIIRDILHQGSNKLVANSKTYRYRLTSSDTLTSTEIRKAVRALKNAKAKPFIRNGKKCYIAIVSPNTTYDLQSDEMWQDVSKYQDKTQIFSGEIGMLFGVIFIETTEAKTFSAADLTDTATTLTAAATGAYTAETKVLKIAEALTDAQAAALVGRKILITSGATGAVSEQDVIAAATAGTAGSASITLTTGLSDSTVANYNSKTIYPGEAGAEGVTVGSTLVLGQNAFGVVDIENGSRPRMIVKPAGSAGTADPLEQVSTVGWKVEAFTAKILQETFMIRIEHGVSA